MAKNNLNKIEESKQILRAAGYFVDSLWALEDIITRAEEQERPKISKKQAKEIMLMMARSHDANVGVNWEFIDCITEIYLDGK
ncbi:hypothetical protein [Aurantibacillus circumpalustris]|uniref:hypothetical protein n=1 Tax=Aurantibacillus circumpalustris TaxID=3036359 RepID=UPI00295AD30C|nr:hypothetical protein [Aurantibacillus circumpalustris]